MKIQVIWNNPDHTRHFAEFPISKNDAHREDIQFQFAKAKFAAVTYFRDTLGEEPLQNELVPRIVKD